MFGRFRIRTDLALEARESFEEDDVKIRGVRIEEEDDEELEIHTTRVVIETENGAKTMGKPVGTYITMEAPNMSAPDEDYHREISEELAYHLKKMIGEREQSVLVVGLGSGDPAQLTPEVDAALRRCDTVAGYSKYVDFIRDRIHGKRLIETGMKGEVERCRDALAAAAAGASVTHVDASKGMVTWAKENARSSGLGDAPIRWIVDDCVKFVEREIRRGNHYDAIIMDPPSYGRGPKGEIWKIEEAIHPLIKLCAKLLSDKPLFFLVNSYTTGLAPAVLTYMLATELAAFHGHVDSQEVGLPVSGNGLVLPCGASGRWEI